MIQGHTFTALLLPEAYDDSWVRWHTLVHGLTAPMFLIAAGLAYGLGLKDEPRMLLGFGQRITQRALTLIVLGYGLQLPRASFAEIGNRPELRALALQAGPLQLIGVCLLLAEALRRTSRDRRALAVRLALATGLIVATAPWAWKLRLSATLPLWLGTWFDGYAGSLFPALPWAAFFGLGVLVALARESSEGRRPARAFAARLVALGIGSVLGTYTLYTHGWVWRSLYGDYELWHTSPLYVAFRSGAALAWLGLLMLGEPLMASLFVRVPRLAHLAETLATKSLVAYVTHLLLLYGTPFTRGLAKLGPRLSLLECSALCASIFATTAVVTLLWRRYVASGYLGERLAQRLTRGWLARVR